jgi:site-specific DNA-methyltransferase (adenine-specific)
VPSTSGIPCFFTQRQGVLFVDKDDITDNFGLIDKYKLLIPRAPIAGQTDFSKPVGFYYEGNIRIAEPGQICTESWLVAYSSSQLEEVLSFKSYLLTKIFRFLLLQSVVSQDVTRNSFQFIPDFGKYEGIYTDEFLRRKWKISADEWDFIDSKIKDVNIESSVENDPSH